MQTGVLSSVGPTVFHLTFKRDYELKDHLMNHRQVAGRGCWEWTRGRSRQGYGTVKIDGKARKVHRVSACLFLGMPIDSELDALHHCDNPPCFNPAHLYLGTDRDNHRDMVARGRSNRARGECHGRSKLDVVKVREIRRANQAGATYADLGRSFGISSEQAARVCKRANWKHV